MMAIVEKVDDFGMKSRFWIVGKDKQSCWRQLDDLQSYEINNRTGTYYDIIAWEENGITRMAIDGTIVTNSTKFFN